MLIAEFSHKGEEIEIDDALWQHDYGQKIQIKGLDLPEVFEVHFAWKDIEKAKVVTGSTIDGVSTVDIPNVALEQRRAITAYVYLSNAVEGETVNTILMTVNKRKAPENFEIPEKIDLFHHTVEATAEYQRQAKESEERAAGLSADAEAWAHGREDHPDQAQDNAKYYAEQAAKSAAEVPGKTEQAKKDIEAARKRAVSAVTSQQETSVQAVATEGKKHTDATKKYAETVASSRQAVEETAQAVATQAQEVSQNTQTVANNTNNAAKSAESAQTSANNAAKSAEGAQTSANNAAKSAEGVQGAVDQITKNTQDVASLKGDISNKITKFYASNQGETRLADSDNGKIMDMMIYGKSEQKKYNGYQLLEHNASEYNFTATTSYYGLVNNASESIKAGTYYLRNLENTPTVLITFLNESKGVVKQEYLTNKTEKQITFNEDVAYVKYIIQGLTIGTTYKGTVKLILASISNTDFEPYVGGQPSPSPDYPQEIKSVVNPTVKIVGKNLLSYASCELGNTSGIDGTLGVNNNYIRSQFVKVCPGKVITLSAAEGYVTHKIVEYDANNAMVKNNESGTANVITITLNKNTVKARTVVRLKEAGVIPDEKDIQIQLEYGITRTAYKPYHEQTVTLPYTLNAIPVSSGGNVTIDGQQYVADYVDVERGKLVQKVGVANQDTFQVVDWSGSGTIAVYDTTARNAASTAGHCMTTISEKYSKNWTAENKIYHFTQPVGQKLVIILPKAITTVEQGEAIRTKGFKFYYELVTPTETDLTEEEIEAFKALVTYYPATNTSVTSDQLDGYIVFDYPISLSDGWDYVKKQLNDNRDYIYNMATRTQDIDTQSAEAYVNSEYAVALTELEV